MSFPTFDVNNKQAITLSDNVGIIGGNVGIGTDSPNALFHVNGGMVTDEINFNLNWINGNPSLVRTMQHIKQNGHNFALEYYAGNIYENSPFGEHNFYTSINKVWRNSMKIDIDGNVGIGTTDPQGVFDARANSNYGLIMDDKGSLDVKCNDYPHASIDTQPMAKDTIHALHLHSYHGYGSHFKHMQNQIKFSVTKGAGGANDVAALIGTFHGNNYNAATAALYFATADTGENLYSRMVIRENGNVGIGTTNPSYPFVLWSSQTTQQDSTYYSGNPDNYSTNVNPDGLYGYNLSGFGSIYGFGGKDQLDGDKVFSGLNAYGLSLFAKGGLYTRGALISASDRRIKTNIVDISDNEALNTLRLIEPKKYEYISKREKGNATTFGFIAQQIREVFPDAVKIEQDEINCFMDDSSLSEDNILTLSKTNTSDISFNYTDSSGNCYAILSIDNYLPNNPDTQSYIHVYDSSIIDSSNIQIDVSLNENYKIRECCTDASFNVNDMSGNNLYTIPANTILLNGQRVTDFHTLNKSAIFTVATAALQEVDRQLQAEKAKTATLETQVTDLLARVTALESA